MCVVSFIGDHFQGKWKPWQPYIVPDNNGYWPSSFPPLPQPSKEEFDQLKKEVEDLKELLRKAKIYDEKNNEPNCEIEEKMEFLKKVAALIDMDLDDVLKKKT